MPIRRLMLLLVLLVPACGDDPRQLTPWFDGTWQLILSGDCLTDIDADMSADAQSFDLSDGLVTGTITLGEPSGGACVSAEAVSLTGGAYVAPGEPVLGADFADFVAFLPTSLGRIDLSGTVTESGGSGIWASTSGALTGTFVLQP